MYETASDGDRRAQAGIGTLILFVAMVRTKHAVLDERIKFFQCELIGISSGARVLYVSIVVGIG
ncbi:archaellin/type IV pilin N-terminal domain-containing protein [Halostagnicola sp. A56]|uniref:archaellin/type IV pilin N-terminal domain-containing protein n=1 Tax=Halostagnicola sp. A56 TaxID=1495067 RepID=UPI00067883EC